MAAVTVTTPELHAVVRRLIARATCVSGILRVGSDEWFDAPATAQLASVAYLGLQNLPEATPPLKQASAAISGAIDWRAESSVPSLAELQRRRAKPGPLAVLVFDAAAAHRWVDTGSSAEGVPAA